jgi:PAS domain S-box-containing protein
MKRFRDWPLRWKLLLSPGLVVAAALLAGLASYLLLEEQRRSAAEIGQSFAIEEQRLAVLRTAMLKSDLALSRSVTWSLTGADAAILESLRKNSEDRLSAVHLQADRLSGGTYDDEEKRLLADIHNGVTAYEAVARDVLLMLDTDVAQSFTYLSETERRFAQAEAAIRDWEVRHDEVRSAREDEAATRLRRTLLAVGAAMGAAFAAAVALSVALSRAISGGVRDVTQVMGRLAAGDKTVEVPSTDRGDEVGTMIRSVAVFKKTALALDRLAEDRAKAEEENRAALEREVEKLAESEQRFRDIAESSSDWFWETDDQDRVTMLSDRFFEVTALPPEEVIGRSRLEYAKSARSQEDAAKWVTYAKQIAQRLPFRDLQYQLSGKDGRTVYVRSSGQPFFAKDGDFVGYRGASSDVTDLVKAQQQVEEQRRRLEGITANLFEGVLLVDPQGIILFANPSARRLLELDDADPSGHSLDEAIRVVAGGADLGFVEGILRRVRQGKGLFVDDDAAFRIVASGKKMEVAFASACLHGDDGAGAVVISFRCIDALKAAQREALQSSRLASVGQLAAGIAHEINTPIQYIGDNLRFFESSIVSIDKACHAVRAALAEGGLPPEALARVDAAFEEAEVPYLMEELPTAVRQSLDGVGHVAKIVRSMKEFSHPGSTAKVVTDINRAIESTLTVTTNEWKHTARIEKDLAPDLPKILCLPADINQVLLNLIVNASQAMEGRDKQGLIRISTRADGDGIEIRVADNGPGVPDTLRERIFDPFFTTKPVGKGTGQGLAISMDVVVNKHGGRLSVEDTPGGGATFVVRLPIGDDNKPPVGEEGGV